MVNNFFADDSIFGEVLENKQQEEALSSSVDLQGIFGVIYDLFSRLGILNVTEENTTGISLKFEYPDSKFSDETISAVIFDIEQRKRLVYQTSAGSISQEKPRELVTQRNVITGQIESFYSYSYENQVTLDVYSTSSERLLQIISYLETVFTKYDGYLQKYFTKVLYLGMTSSNGNSHNLFKNRMFAKTIHLKIVTESPYTLLHEEIQEINKQQVNPYYLKKDKK
jgi:hypothetical protein